MTLMPPTASVVRSRGPRPWMNKLLMQPLNIFSCWPYVMPLRLGTPPEIHNHSFHSQNCDSTVTGNSKCRKRADISIYLSSVRIGASILLTVVRIDEKCLYSFSRCENELCINLPNIRMGAHIKIPDHCY